MSSARLVERWPGISFTRSSYSAYNLMDNYMSRIWFLAAVISLSISTGLAQGSQPDPSVECPTAGALLLQHVSCFVLDLWQQQCRLLCLQLRDCAGRTAHESYRALRALEAW